MQKNKGSKFKGLFPVKVIFTGKPLADGKLSVTINFFRELQSYLGTQRVRVMTPPLSLRIPCNTNFM